MTIKIQGKYLAWAIIHLSFFLTFVFIDSSIDWDSTN